MFGRQALNYKDRSVDIFDWTIWRIGSGNERSPKRHFFWCCLRPLFPPYTLPQRSQVAGEHIIHSTFRLPWEQFLPSIQNVFKPLFIASYRFMYFDYFARSLSLAISVYCLIQMILKCSSPISRIWLYNLDWFPSLTLYLWSPILLFCLKHR